MILLASPSSQKIITRWKQGVRNFVEVTCVDNLDSLRDNLARVNPSILLLDYGLPNLGGAKGVADFIKLSPKTGIIVLSSVISEDNEWELFKAGVRGCCPIDIDAKRLLDVIGAIRRGELWIRRSITCRLLEELGIIALEKSQIKQAANALLANLTQREQEIAMLVGKGESNKQIALRLSICERTVKAHLTEVFRKLKIEDRLKLALIISGSQDRSSQNSSYTQ